MIKSDLLQRVAGQNPHLFQRDVEKIVDAILGEIIAAMARDERIELRGFGAFSVKHRSGLPMTASEGRAIALLMICLPLKILHVAHDKWHIRQHHNEYVAYPQQTQDRTFRL